MEAESFLASGFATRAAISKQATGWTPLSRVARTWQPSRLKGIQVSPEFGSPFLAATQVFDVRPVARKWLSLDRTSDHSQRFVPEGTILVTCSGSVGRATLADASVHNTLVSHDLLRIEAIDQRQWGWLYAYLRAPAVRQMMASAQYGHMIKHLEVGHLDALPFIEMRDPTLLKRFSEMASSVIAHRNDAVITLREAEEDFRSLVGVSSPVLADGGENGFSRPARETLFSGRRRFDAHCHNPSRVQIEDRLKAASVEMRSLAEIGCSVWLPNRFKRVPAEDGVDLVDSSSIFEINPDFKKRISPKEIADRNNGFVKPGWLLMSRSGQVYGLLGSVALATDAYCGKVVTDDIIRISTEGTISPGYLHLTLSHETLGRPRVKSIAYGSSIPHIEVEDLKALQVPRFDPGVEQSLGNLVEKAYANWSSADALEQELALLADAAVTEFVTA